MIPPSLPAPRRSLALALITAAALAVPCAQAEDAQPVDIAQMLQALRQFREQTATKTKADKAKAIQEVASAAASGESAVNAWEKAVMATQFDGVTKEATAFKGWRENEGEALHEAEAKNAARLYFQWLGLTLQRSSGVPVKDLLPAVINYTKELASDQAGMENLEDAIRREKEKNDGKRGNQRRSSNDGEVRKMHEQILNRPLGGSLVVQWLKLGEWVAVEKWEHTPGNLDGIFEKIVLPELRAQRDQRVLEYWDTKIKRESENASKSKLDFEHDKFNTQRLPVLLWKRASDMANVGMRNRAATEMFTLIRKYPSHPDATEWMSKLEEMLMPPAATPPASAPTAPAPTGTAPAVPPVGTLPPAAR